METWRDIVAEMRYLSGQFTLRSSSQEYLSKYANLIEAACKTMEDVLIVEQEENAKLRRALEPVMKCFTSFFVEEMTGKPSTQVDLYCDEEGDFTIENEYGGTNLGGPIKEIILECVNAVCEAQAIMKEGAE